MTKVGPKLAFLFILALTGLAGLFGALLVGWFVVVARAVSRKTPLYFISTILFSIFLCILGGCGFFSWSTFYILRDVVHKYLGMEPSGRKFNDMELDYNHQPHNPMVNDDDSDDDGVVDDDVYILWSSVCVCVCHEK